MALSSYMVPLGTPAPDFSLPTVDGYPDHTLALADLAGSPALLVAFLSNHCPYVRHIESALGTLLAEYAEAGVAAVAICSNETDNYPDDAADHLAEQRHRAGFGFPYLVDSTQRVARAYRAACTPDFFLYGADRRLAYRGALDESTPGSGIPVSGDALRAAFTKVLAGEPVPEPHRPSMGCGIKWRPGNEPTG